MKLVIILALALAASPAFARIGETEAQIEKRYGKPKYSKNEGGAPARAYVYKGFEIVVAFDSGVSAFEEFWKAGGAPMSVGELAALLSANFGPKPPMPEQQGLEFYYRTRDRFAYYNAATHKFVVCIPGAINRMSSLGIKADTEKMKGF